MLLQVVALQCACLCGGFAVLAVVGQTPVCACLHAVWCGGFEGHVVLGREAAVWCTSV